MDDNHSSGEVEFADWNIDHNQCLFCNIQLNERTGKYNLIVCYLKAETTLSKEVLVGGMIAEGVLARKEEKDELHLIL